MITTQTNLGGSDGAKMPIPRLSPIILIALSVLLLSASLSDAAEKLPTGSPYLGEIKRDASGHLIVEPPQPPAQQTTPTPAYIIKPQPEATESSRAPLSSAATKRLEPTPSTAGTSADNSLAKTIRVGPTQAIKTISGAASLARDGDTIEIEAGDYLSDVAVWKQNRLTIRGIGGMPRLIANGASAERKAIWVIRGGEILIENIEFNEAKVPDKNGAGIRFEKGRLTVKNCRFLNNQNGILTSSAKDMELVVENSEFGHNGAGDGYSHNIYVGAIKSFHLTGSYSHHANVGHLVKTRAAENYIFYNRLTDEIGGRASYELQIANGGIAYVLGNIIQQGSQTENSNIVSYGDEALSSGRNVLYLAYNTIIDDRPTKGRYLIFPKNKDKTLEVFAANNLLVGGGSLDKPQGSLTGNMKAFVKDILNPQANSSPVIQDFKSNLSVDLNVFAAATRFDYRVKSNSGLTGRTIATETSDGIKLIPDKEYHHPTSTTALSGKPRVPGALQSLAN